MVESIGERLRLAREAKKLNIRDVVKQTNISFQYIEALEDEEFDKFPSETYLIGFLRSYADFLKLDSDTIIQSYRGYKIGESATPLEELTRATRPSFDFLLSGSIAKYKNYIFGGLGLLLVITVFFIIKAVISMGVDTDGGRSLDAIKKEYNEKNKGSEISNVTPLQLLNDQGLILVSKNEAAQFLVNTKEVIFILKEIIQKAGEEKVVLEILPSRTIEIIELNKTKTIVINGIPREISISLKGLTESKAKIMVALSGRQQETEVKQNETPVKSDPVDNTRVVAQNNKSLKIIFEVEFIQKSFIEIYLDGVQKKRGFIAKDSRERWEANEYIQVKVGNAGGIRAIINGREYPFGMAGQVANKIITWKKDPNNPNVYEIVLKDW